ncbi:MAG: hypothetical protein KC636_09880 [Myxococcales bacterium]|nr:hypothetical protein [Myxococcales bacterium]
MGEARGLILAEEEGPSLQAQRELPQTTSLPSPAPVDVPRRSAADEDGDVDVAGHQLLTCLPGPVALFSDGAALLAVDLRRLRSFLVYRRLARDIGGQRSIAVQRLLSPVVVARPPAEVRLCVAARDDLLALGVDLDAFGEDAVAVRGVPAHLKSCIDDADVTDLIERIIPWLRLRSREGDETSTREVLTAIAGTRGGDPAPRLARRWLAEALELCEALDNVPGIRRWSGEALLGEPS